MLCLTCVVRREIFLFMQVWTNDDVWMPDKTRFVADWLVDTLVKSIRSADPTHPGTVPSTHSGYWALLTRVVAHLPLSCPLNNVTDAFVAAVGSTATGHAPCCLYLSVSLPAA